MKKWMVTILTICFILVGCGGANMEFAVEEPPKYKDGVSYPMVISVSESGEMVTGMEIVATLEMAKMDHGVIEVVFSDRGDGTYEGEVELPMAGEWIANVNADYDGDTYEEVLIFDVKEG